jgi:hypothetical protein
MEMRFENLMDARNMEEGLAEMVRIIRCLLI